MQKTRWRWLVPSALLGLQVQVGSDAVAAASARKAMPADAPHLFVESERCIACHSNLTTPSGQDMSFGYQWRATMMALPGRDPYWLADVRRESIEHPTAIAAIEDRCSVCHLPVAHTAAVAGGQPPQLFALLEAAARDPASVHLQPDGVTCTVCHRDCCRQRRRVLSSAG